MANTILERIADGESMRKICESEEMPAKSTVQQWVIRDIEGFAAQYARAREVQAEGYADEIIEIADDSKGDWVETMGRNGMYMKLDIEAVMRSRLRVDSRKWVLAKLLPKKYGSLKRHEVSGPDGGAIPISGPGADEQLIRDAIRLDLLDRLPARLQELAKKRDLAGNLGKTPDNCGDVAPPGVSDDTDDLGNIGPSPSGEGT